MEQLSAALRANAKGLLCTEAAIELLLEQPGSTGETSLTTSSAALAALAHTTAKNDRLL